MRSSTKIIVVGSDDFFQYLQNARYTDAEGVERPYIDPETENVEHHYNIHPEEAQGAIVFGTVPNRIAVEADVVVEFRLRRDENTRYKPWREWDIMDMMSCIKEPHFYVVDEMDCEHFSEIKAGTLLSDEVEEEEEEDE